MSGSTAAGTAPVTAAHRRLAAIAAALRCRHELPTDDHRYEARKRHEEDAKGAANAVSHNDFLYI